MEADAGGRRGPTAATDGGQPTQTHRKWLSPRQIGTLLKTAAVAWVEDGASSRGAALAYYSVFSFAPLLILLTALAGLILGQRAAEGAVFYETAQILGPDNARLVQNAILSASGKTTGLVASSVGVLMLLVGGTAVLSELQSALNVIWRAGPTRGSPVWRAMRNRLLSVALVFGMGALFLASTLVTTAIASAGTYIKQAAPGLLVVVEVVQPLLSFAIATLFFAMAFKILPERPVGWRDVWLGALITAMLFSGGHYLIGLYIGSRNLASTYGAAAAPFVILLWIYYSAQILLFGAELAKAHRDLRAGDEDKANRRTRERRHPSGT